MSADRAAEPHPTIQKLLELREKADVPRLNECTPEEARAIMERTTAARDTGIELASVEDRLIEGPGGEPTVRIYEPEGHEPGSPGILYAHGGGFVVGSLDTADAICRALADETGYLVASVDYRLAPEHPFPAGLLDFYAALEWFADAAPDLGVDPDRIVTAGDSAGGNFATVAALMSRDRGGPGIAYQVLLYPTTGNATETESFQENGDGGLLTTEEMRWFDEQYVADPIDRRNGYANPRQLHDLSGLPPATVVTAGFDPLRDDGAAYADRLAECGVPVTHHNYPDVIHGFAGMIGEPIDVPAAREAHADVAADLRDALE
jgi:acetyl esterase